MTTGTVSRYFDDKGYGFIRSDDHAADLFVHAKWINGASELQEGQMVEFTPIFDETRGRYRAEDVRII